MSTDDGKNTFVQRETRDHRSELGTKRKCRDENQYEGLPRYSSLLSRLRY